jgi:predicted permease
MARHLARFGSRSSARNRSTDARGAPSIDTLVRDVLYAFRTFRRAPFAAVTIVATVALGLGLIAAVFTFYNALFLRVDAVRNPGELFAVERPVRPGGGAWMPFTRPQYEALRRETGVFTDTVAMLRGIKSRVDGRPVSAVLVTGNFFQVLGVQAALGRTLTPADDERSASRAVIVLSHSGWHKLFAADPAAIGRSLAIDGAPYEVVGVMPAGFRGLAVVPPDYWAPLGAVGQFRRTYAGRDDEVQLDDVIGRLKAAVSAQAATAAITSWAAGRTDLATAGWSRPFIRLKPRQGTASADVVAALLTFAPIFFAFGLILMIGCANVANLLLARGVARQREIGIRLSLGATRRRIVRQLLTENLLLALLSAACGFAVSRGILETAVGVAIATLPPEIAEQVSLTVPSADWRVGMLLVAGAIVSTLFFGLVPALQATRLELVRTMRGEVTRDARPGRARNALIVLQVAASALLLICAAVFLRGALAAATADPGLRTSDTVIVPIANEPLRAALLQAVTAHPSVVAVAASSPETMGHFRAATAWTVGQTPAGSSHAANMAAATSISATVGFQFVSPEYFEVLGIPIVRGRAFTPAERSAESGVVAVSERTARKLWPNVDAVGEVMRFEADQPPDPRQPGAPRPASHTYTVIGIVRDVGQPGVFGFSGADVYLPIGAESPGTSLTLRVHGDPRQARGALLQRLTQVDPALGEIYTLRTLAGRAIYILRIAFWVTVVLAGLALALTLSGLFSVLSYLVEQRAQEIGVRMALGATGRDVAELVLSQSIRPVGIGLLIGGGLAAALAIALMSTRAASQIGGVVHVVDPLAYAASVLIIVTACVLAASIPALRAARIDPIATLRKD